MKYFSMFSGIGGFELGFPKDWECVGYSEIDKHAIKIYEKHFSNHRNYGNARDIIPESIERFDLLCGGFPCQSFSLSGKRGGMSEARGTLFFEICRIIRVQKPRFLLLENVQGLLSSSNGEDFKTILRLLDELGYDVQWQLLNGKYWLPQNRERIYIIGTARTQPGLKIFPFGTEIGISSKEIQQQYKKQNIKINYINNQIEKSQTNRIYINTGLLPCLMASHVPMIQNKLHRSYNIYETKNSILPTLTALGASSGQQIKIHQGDQIHNINKPAATLTSSGGGNGRQTGLYLIQGEIRRLTPIECERIMGFPDNWTLGISENQRYKCLGNAVMPPVIKSIIEKLINNL